MSIAVNKKDWSCPKKRSARKRTIIEPYRVIFGKNIPRGKQYWTMCGQCGTFNGNPIENCELDQIVKSGLITPNQFHGVEKDPNIHSLNVKAWPNANANWYCGYFLQTMDNADNEDNFNPAIVNADLVTMPDGSIGCIADIMKLLSSSTKNVMLIVNLVLKARHKKAKMEDVIEGLNKNDVFQSAIETDGWEYLNGYYPYAGTGDDSRSKMGSMIFYLKG